MMLLSTVNTSRLLGFAKKCKKLGLYLHVSTCILISCYNNIYIIIIIFFKLLLCYTAYVNGERQGLIMEKPFSTWILYPMCHLKNPTSIYPSAGYYSWNRVGFRFEVICAWKWSFSKDERIGSAKVTNCALMFN